jgi:hypothetical protein
MTSTTARPPAGQQFPGDEQLWATWPVLPVQNPPLGPVVDTQLIALGGAFLVRSGPGHDHHVGHIRVQVLDGGPGVFQGDDDPAAVLLDAPGVSHGRTPFFSVRMPTGRSGERVGASRPAGAGSGLPAIPGPGFAEAPRARVGPQDAFRGAPGKDLGVPLRVEGRARTLRGPHPDQYSAWLSIRGLVAGRSRASRSQSRPNLVRKTS